MFPTFAPILSILGYAFVFFAIALVGVWLVSTEPDHGSEGFRLDAAVTLTRVTFNAAWHDACAFDSVAVLGTCKAARKAQLAQLALAHKAGVYGNGLLVLEALSAGQTAYHVRHGRLPVDKRAFAFHVVEWGIDSALACEGF